MLEHLSAKFRAPSQDSLLEPRAALILNRFTRTLTVMYATNAVSKILGITPEELQDTGFYECMQEDCLDDAIKCLESAKANDSIAYLRFWYRDPRGAEDLEEDALDQTTGSSDSEDGGVELSSRMDLDSPQAVDDVHSPPIYIDTSGEDKGRPSNAQPSMLHNGHTSSGESTDLEQDSVRAIFDRAAELSRSSTSESSVLVLSPPSRRRRIQPPRIAPEPLEIEAVISCTSDGLVVVLRRARPTIPSLPDLNAAPQHRHGLFAAPWGVNPIRPHLHHFNPQYPFQHGLLAPLLPAGGPPLNEFMNSIREVAVFAWSLTGINGNIASYGHGTPRGEAVPLIGLPVWDPYGQPSPSYLPPENQAAQRWGSLEKTNEPDSLVPYQHPQQGANLRAQNGYGLSVLTGADHQASVGHGSRNGQFAFAYSSSIQAQHLGLAPREQGGWQASIPANAGHHVSHSQHQGSQGSSGGVAGGNRYFWQ